MITIAESKTPMTKVITGDKSLNIVEAFPVMSLTKPLGNVIIDNIDNSARKAGLTPLSMFPKSYFFGNSSFTLLMK